ncbi:MAG TPA: sigma-70 family RNA polymerase sigma factor [Gemmatimonadales bacterium]|nr:sigma-70 family RNA polymerase sigma factor [Gemmatimonadales bacterium]
MTNTATLDAMSLPNADAVIASAKRGDPAALEALYRAYSPATFNLARRICRTTEDAEDVLQETFFEVCRSIRNYRGDGSLWGWIRTVASSKALMRLRRNKYRDTDELNDDFAPARLAPHALRMDLESALDRLSDTARAVVWLHDVEGYTHEEIGQQMGKTASFSKSQLARAHQRMRLWLDEGATA